MLNYQYFVPVGAFNLEKTVGDFFKYGLIIIAVFAGLAIIAKIVSSFIYFRTSLKIDKPGVRKVDVLEINKEIVDDTMARAALGYMIAGDRGWLFGALTGTQHEEVRSITFKIYYNDGTEQKLTCPVKHDLCQELLKKTDLR